MTAIGDLIHGKIESLAFGGKGILRHEGRVFFIPFAAPDDILTARITKLKSTYGLAEIHTLNKPSRHRAIPRCPYFGICGGCQLQHLNYPIQLGQKRQWVEDALVRIGGFQLEQPLIIVPADPHWHYRRHVHLNLQFIHGQFRAGYISEDNQTLLPIKECPIFVSEESSILQQLQEVVKDIHLPQYSKGRITLVKKEVGFLLHFHFDQTLPLNSDQLFSEALTKNLDWKGILISAPNRHKSYGDTTIQFDIEGLKIKLSARAFMQNHPQQSLNIYHEILSIVLKEEIKYIIDCYSGIGISSQLLGRAGVEVVGIESHPEAVKLAEENCKINTINNVRPMQGKTEDLLESILDEKPCEAILLNPPKTGLDSKVIEVLLRKPFREIIYVSCMPSTLARDLRLLSSQYRINACRAFDMFPQTTHVETLVHLQRNNKGT